MLVEKYTYAAAAVIIIVHRPCRNYDEHIKYDVLLQIELFTVKLDSDWQITTVKCHLYVNASVIIIQ